MADTAYVYKCGQWYIDHGSAVLCERSASARRGGAKVDEVQMERYKPVWVDWVRTSHVSVHTHQGSHPALGSSTLGPKYTNHREIERMILGGAGLLTRETGI